MSSPVLPLERILKQDRLIVLAGLAVITLLAWLYTARMAVGTDHMEFCMRLAEPQMQGWTWTDLWMLFVMWGVMMIAMMVPSATPMILLFAVVNRRRRERASPFVPTGMFLLGYLLMWGGYSLAATALQGALHSAALLSPMMVSTSGLLGGIILLSAGIFQWTPLKKACLVRCRSPLSFLTTEWREGTRGALVMGFRHGMYCVGCCWVLMALLFVAGVMNLAWVGLITILVLGEKALPKGDLIARLVGLVLVAAGLLII